MILTWQLKLLVLTQTLTLQLMLKLPHGCKLATEADACSC
jgi:hypothetical protein